MPESPCDVRTLDELRAWIHRTLCEKENLLADQFAMSELQLTRGGRPCGMQFLLGGPRSVRLGAIWAADHNQVYFYDTQGARYLKVQLPHRLDTDEADGRRFPRRRIGVRSGPHRLDPDEADGRAA